MSNLLKKRHNLLMKFHYSQKSQTTTFETYQMLTISLDDGALRNGCPFFDHDNTIFYKVIILFPIL